MRENREQQVAPFRYSQTAIQSVSDVPADVHQEGQHEGARSSETRFQFDRLKKSIVCSVSKKNGNSE